MSNPQLSESREAYARNVTARVEVQDTRLHDAFAAVPREKFLGPGPWLIVHPRRGYVLSKSADPRLVYVDGLIALDAALGINNGQPSAHANWIGALGLEPGERVLHIGAGTGYYTAILGELVGPNGRVKAIEIAPRLAAWARESLADRPNIEVCERSGAVGALPGANVIYVNAGATAPLAVWLDALARGGRLLFPLTGNLGGGMLLVKRGEAAGWPARFVSGAAFIDMVGGRHSEGADAVRAAFRRGGANEVRSLWRDDRRQAEDWLRGDGWRLSRVDPAG